MGKQTSTISEADKIFDFNNFYKGSSVNNNYQNNTLNNIPSYNNFNFGVV